MTTQPLSPAVQAIINAGAARRCREEWDNVNDPPCNPDDPGWVPCSLCQIPPEDAAAALRAAAKQVDPSDSGGGFASCDGGELFYRREERFEMCAELLEIATELEGRHE